MSSKQSLAFVLFISYFYIFYHFFIKNITSLIKPSFSILPKSTSQNRLVWWGVSILYKFLLGTISGQHGTWVFPNTTTSQLIVTHKIQDICPIMLRFFIFCYLPVFLFLLITIALIRLRSLCCRFSPLMEVWWCKSAFCFPSNLSFST